VNVLHLLSFFFRNADGIKALLGSDSGLCLCVLSAPPRLHARCTPLANQPLDTLAAYFQRQVSQRAEKRLIQLRASVMDLT
jgi:hypothetical protein